MGLTFEEDARLVRWGQKGVISDAEGQKIIYRLYCKLHK